MKNIKPFFLSSKKIKAKKALKILQKKYKHYSLEEANVVIVLGGDGTILPLVNDKSYIKKNIFGMNRGTVGFLMNNYEAENLLDRIKSSKVTKLNPVYMKVTDVLNKTHLAFSLNEVSLLRQNRFAASIRVKINSKVKINKLVCDLSLIHI